MNSSVQVISSNTKSLMYKIDSLDKSELYNEIRGIPFYTGPKFNVFENLDDILGSKEVYIVPNKYGTMCQIESIHRANPNIDKALLKELCPEGINTMCSNPMCASTWFNIGDTCCPVCNSKGVLVIDITEN